MVARSSANILIPSMQVFEQNIKFVAVNFSFQFKHGAPTDPSRHVGDLGNIEVDDDGFAEIHITDALLSLSGGHRGVVGRSIVVTENEDDLGRGGTAESFITGASGKPIACGVVAYII